MMASFQRRIPIHNRVDPVDRVFTRTVISRVSRTNCSVPMEGEVVFRQPLEVLSAVQ